MTTVTFATDDHLHHFSDTPSNHAGPDASAVVEAVTSCGFRMTTPQSATHTVLDTAERRISAAGLRLLIRRAVSYEAVLTEHPPQASSVPAAMNVVAIPESVSELPPGPLRTRIREAVGGGEQLRVVTSFSTVERQAVLQNADGRTIASVTLFDALQSEVVGKDWTIEITAAAGHPKAAGELGELLMQLGCTRMTGDTADLAVRTALRRAVTAQAAIHRHDRVALDPQMASIDGYRAVLVALHTTIDFSLQLLSAAHDTPALKALRVAVRRSRTVLTESRAVIPEDIRKRFGVEFVWLASMTGAARDLDVTLLTWDRFVATAAATTTTETAPALEPLRRYFVRQRIQAHDVLTEMLQSKRTTKLRRGWTQWLEAARPGELAKGAPVDEAPDAAAPLGRVIAERSRRIHERLVEQARAIDATSPAEELHEVRKTAKQLRYLLDSFTGGLASAPPKAFVKRLKALQDQLGAHQDADVQHRRLQQIVATVEEVSSLPETVAAIDQLLAALDAQRRHARDGFDRQFAKFATFSAEDVHVRVHGGKHDRQHVDQAGKPQRGVDAARELSARIGQPEEQ